MKWIAAACLWFSSFLLKAFVNRVNRRLLIRNVRFWRSTWLVDTNERTGLPTTRTRRAPVQTGGE